VAGVGLRRLGEEAPATEAFRSAAAAGVWRSPLQRPRSLFWPSLASSPLPGEDLEASWPWCRRARLDTEAAMEALAAEFEGVRQHHPPRDDDLGDGLSYWVQKCGPEGGCSYRFNAMDAPSRGLGFWAEYTVWDPDRLRPGDCSWAYFPQACAVASRLRASGVPLTRMGITEVHPPRTRIPRHHSPQQGRLRLLCPLSVAPGSRSRGAGLRRCGLGPLLVV